MDNKHLFPMSKLSAIAKGEMIELTGFSLQMIDFEEDGFGVGSIEVYCGFFG